jgi:hypothetical protein
VLEGYKGWRDLGTKVAELMLNAKEAFEIARLDLPHLNEL